jgi:kumamolisin
VVSVGGTSLSVGQDGSYAGENAWEDVLSQGGSGGGLSSVFTRPSWQTGVPGLGNRYSNGMRQVPDIAAAAALDTPWAVAAGGRLTGLFGTSASTPFWAGVLALVRQYARQQGHGPLPFLDPMLYQIASTPQPNQPFHDVTTGSNRYYPATTGWDFATGLGSPDALSLAQDVVSYLQHRGR